MTQADRMAQKPLPAHVKFDRQIFKDNSACFREEQSCPFTIYPPTKGDRYELYKNDRELILGADNLPEIENYVKDLIKWILGPGNYSYSIVDKDTEKVIIKINGLTNYCSKIHDDSFAPEDYTSTEEDFDDEFDNDE